MTGFDAIAAIKKRRSCRTFLKDKPLDGNGMDILRSALTGADNPFADTRHEFALADSHKDASWEKVGTYGIIKNPATYIVVGSGTDNIDTVAAAFMAEQAVLSATSVGIGSVWLGATFTRGRIRATAAFPPDYCIPAVIAMGYPDKPRLLERAMRGISGADTRRPWHQLFFHHTPDTPLTRDMAGAFAVPLEMVRLAPSATNSQPWRVVMTDSGFHFYASYSPSLSGMNLKHKMLDMGIALCHFYLSARQLNLPGKISIMNNPAEMSPGYHYIASWLI